MTPRLLLSEVFMRALWIAVCGAALSLVADVALAAEALVADAADAGDPAAVRTLSEAKSRVNPPQADGMTALHWATYYDDEELVKRLLEAGADPKAVNRYQVS